MIARAGLALVLTTSQAAAWTFSPSPICTLSHEEGGASVIVTHDPSAAQPYTITVTGSAPWIENPVFEITFIGPNALTISTDRHAMTNDGGVFVADTGFGNVLNGLAFNNSAIARLGAQSVTVTLDDIAAPMAAFRACPSVPTA